MSGQKHDLPSRHYAALKWEEFPETLPDIDATVLVVCDFVGLTTVSYTHLTLPTKA